MSKTIYVHYYAIFREQRGLSQEIVTTEAATTRELYKELAGKYSFKMASSSVKAAVNNEFADWETVLKAGDHVAFIPPVAGG